MLLTTGNIICIFVSFYMYLWIRCLHASPCLLPLKVRRLFALHRFYSCFIHWIIQCLHFTLVEFVNIYMFMHAVYFSQGCAADAEAAEWWSWLDLIQTRGLRVFKMWFFSLQRSHVGKSVMAYQCRARCIALCGQFVGLNVMKWCYQCAFFGKVGKGSQTGGARSRWVQPWLRTNCSM